jgi:hypothetical protein
MHCSGHGHKGFLDEFLSSSEVTDEAPCKGAHRFMVLLVCLPDADRIVVRGCSGRQDPFRRHDSRKL